MKTVLVADDQEHLRLLVSATLAGPDYRIVEARDGNEAFDLARRESPDLLILDWMMPARTGVEVLQALREDPATRDVPVIMLTARAQRSDRDQVERLGVYGYLVKPFSPVDLLELVDEAFAGGTPE